MFTVMYIYHFSTTTQQSLSFLFAIFQFVRKKASLQRINLQRNHLGRLSGHRKPRHHNFSSGADWSASQYFQYSPGSHPAIEQVHIYRITYIRGGSRIPGKGVHMYKGVGVRFADLILLKYPMVSLRPNYFISIGYLKTGAGRGVRLNPLNPL